MSSDLLCNRPSQEQVESAVRVLLRWIGENPDCEALLKTPKCVAALYGEIFGGYNISLAEELFASVESVALESPVLVPGINYQSHCEHHMLPVIGSAHVSYLPDGKAVSFPMIARIVETFACRLQTQEAMTAQIANFIQDLLHPRGLGVIVEAEHMCMATRGIRTLGIKTMTSHFKGTFRDAPEEQVRLVEIVLSKKCGH